MLKAAAHRRSARLPPAMPASPSSDGAPPHRSCTRPVCTPYSLVAAEHEQPQSTRDSLSLSARVRVGPVCKALWAMPADAVRASLVRQVRPGSLMRSATYLSLYCWWSGRRRAAPHFSRPSLPLSFAQRVMESLTSGPILVWQRHQHHQAQELATCIATSIFRVGIAQEIDCSSSLKNRRHCTQSHGRLLA